MNNNFEMLSMGSKDEELALLEEFRHKIIKEKEYEAEHNVAHLAEVDPNELAVEDMEIMADFENLLKIPADELTEEDYDSFSHKFHNYRASINNRESDINNSRNLFQAYIGNKMSIILVRLLKQKKQ
ncbi:MAG: hypothetical protein WDZ73_01770 [Candidatus Paceibacterota bacterium]